MPLDRLEFLRCGYCRQAAWLVGRRSLAWTRFHAVFVYFEHPEHGGCLIDTGYSPYFLDETRPFPERIYRWLLPVTLNPPRDAVAALAERGIDGESIRYVFVSHFHGDHIAGLRHFPNATFVYRPESHDRLMKLTRSRQVREGFIRRFLPSDFTERAERVEESRFTAGTVPLTGFSTLDYWSDGSLQLVDLPGHADGHTGYMLTTGEAQLFYVVDACWDVEVLLSGRRLPWLSRRLQHDSKAYDATQRQLCEWAEAHADVPLVACHCPLTANWVERKDSDTTHEN